MFSVIEYSVLDTVNRDIIIHFYTNNKERATNCAFGLVNKYKKEKGFQYVADITNHNDPANIITTYTHIKQYIKLFTCVTLDELTDEEIKQEMYIFGGQTLGNMVNACYGEPLVKRYQPLSNKLVDDMSVDEVREIFIEMTLSQLGKYGPKVIDKSDRIFAVIELQEL